MPTPKELRVQAANPAETSTRRSIGAASSRFPANVSAVSNTNPVDEEAAYARAHSEVTLMLSGEKHEDARRP